MASGSGSPSWPHARSGRSHTPALRHTRELSGSGAEMYTMGQSFMTDTFVGIPDLRPGSSSSSLTGAIGETSMASHSRHSRSPPLRNVNMYSAEWPNVSQQVIPGMHASFPGMPGMSSPSFELELHGGNTLYDYMSTTRNSSPESTSSGSSAYCDPNGVPVDPYFQSSSRHNGAGYPVISQPLHTSSSGDEHLRLKAEISQLRRKVRQAEEEAERYRKALEAHSSSGLSLTVGLPTPPPSASFTENWKARTETRKKILCSLNRAGNALCAWHDSRRERREYPPRHAPQGYLNCGCTHEEALFEESLSRHNIGSYYPGESVRMDPALRNPLLKLLKARYGYKDGDFERNPETGEWVDGEGAAYWQQQAVSGSTKRRGDSERH